MAGDPLAESPHAERLGIPEPALERLGGSSKDGRGRRGARLADLHVDDVPAGRLKRGRGGHDIHGVERLDAAPR
jgi:hypothetical protein